MPVIRSKLLILLFLTFGTNTVSASIEDNFSGAWMYGRTENSCAAVTKSQDLKHMYIIRAMPEIKGLIAHWIKGPDLPSYESLGPVEMKFNDDTSFDMDTNDALEEAISFEIPMMHFSDGSDTDIRLTTLKKLSSFSVVKGTALLSGPYSLKGSSKAIRFVERCWD